MNTTLRKRLLCICETAIFIALAFVLNFAKLEFAWLQGGSISLSMIPILVLSLRRGAAWGIPAGLIFGVIDCTMDGGFGWGIWSVLLDYLLAYAAVGACGFFYKMPKAGPVVGTLVGCLMRFAVHFISGVTIYKIYVAPLYGVSLSPDNGLDVVIYSLLYNGGYMLFNTIIAVVFIFILQKAARKLIAPQD